MVRAILEGRKTQTRRVVKLPVEQDHMWDGGWKIIHKAITTGLATFNRMRGKSLKNKDPIICPYGQPGDRLWVRETWALVPQTAYRQSTGVDQVNKPGCNHDAAVFRAGWERCAPSRWRPSIHMPRWASRITLEIVSVRIERLNDISERDALSEGIERLSVGFKDYQRTQWNLGCPKHSFQTLWESINGNGSWQQNPWVWVVEFKRVQP